MPDANTLPADVMSNGIVSARNEYAPKKRKKKKKKLKKIANFASSSLVESNCTIKAKVN